MNVHILGVRHHSPACAHRVIWHIRKFKPAFVLIEGPADFNPRLEELYLAHQLPIAIYSYLSTPEGIHRSSWSPFLQYSPEWQAIHVGKEIGAEVYFIDLPVWHDAFADLENRYADAIGEVAEQLSEKYHQQLMERLLLDNRDALWDHLFESSLSHPPENHELEKLDRALETYFCHLRGDALGSLGDQAREQMMASWIAWAHAQKKGPVIVVCGGYHAPALARLWPQLPTNKPVIPKPDSIDNSQIISQIDHDSSPTAINEMRYGSYLVPYSFKRLDAFTGYASGMPSPAYYQDVWQYGLYFAGEKLLTHISSRLREKKVPFSTADLISVHSRAHGLARLRHHQQPMRIDWLDAFAGTMVKEALNAPLPWVYRGTLKTGTDPILVEAMDVLAGSEVGCLAEQTPQPPLLKSVHEIMKNLSIAQQGILDLNILKLQDRMKSQVLHQLLILEIPSVQRVQGPENALMADGQERWELSFLQHFPHQRAALIEASVWGATLNDAARACLEQKLTQAGSDIQQLTHCLHQAAFAGLSQISQHCLTHIEVQIAQVQKFEPLGLALSSLYSLFQYGDIVAITNSPLLLRVVEAAFERCLWLFESPEHVQACDTFSHLLAVKAITQICADCEAEQRYPIPNTRLSRINSQRARAVLHRKAQYRGAAPVSRGAALGALLSLGIDEENALDNDQEQQLNTAVGLLSQLSPFEIGDALSGLLALAREVLTSQPLFITGIDAQIRAMDDHDFILALPSIRSALSWLPAQERGALARSLLSLYHLPNLSESHLLGTLDDLSAQSVAIAKTQEQQVIKKLAQWGIMIEDLARSGEHP